MITGTAETRLRHNRKGLRELKSIHSHHSFAPLLPECWDQQQEGEKGEGGPIQKRQPAHIFNPESLFTLYQHFFPYPREKKRKEKG